MTGTERWSNFRQFPCVDAGPGSRVEKLQYIPYFWDLIDSLSDLFPCEVDLVEHWFALTGICLLLGSWSPG